MSRSVQPLVSCVLATAGRARFLAQAIKYFQRQTYEPRELLIVDDQGAPAAHVVPDDPRIRYLASDGPTPLGGKLNLAIAAARGSIIQKLDDDDYYHPDFLVATTGALRGPNAAATIAGCASFLVLIAATGHLTFSGSGQGWCAGGTLCFHRELWERRPFRYLPRAEDSWFLNDHAPARARIERPHLYILVRHGEGHAWTRTGATDVTAYFSRRPALARSWRAYVPREDWAFYDSLRTSGPPVGRE